MEATEKHSGITITVVGRVKPTSFFYYGDISLMEAMRAHGIYISASCGGRGTCGKCIVQVLEGCLEITAYDEAKLSEQELLEGYRLACKAFPRERCTLRMVTGDETDFEVIADGLQTAFPEDSEIQENFGIAIDVGTTTIAISLVGVTSSKVRYTYTATNKQRAYGADVITRMKASMDGNGEALRASIQTDLLEGITEILSVTGLSKERIERVAIAGNTTMGHLLLGYPCTSLGSYPFTPVNINTLTLPFPEVLGSSYLMVPVTVLPGISTFVGGDIVAGLLSCSFDQRESISILIDLGTNGEMAIGNKNKILVTSTAAGPAFEGGNISCGIGSVAGAISSVLINREDITIDTIAHKPPIGICGTGVLELVSELVRCELVDDTGLLCEPYFDDGYRLATDLEGKAITLTQRDIREIQMAKSAVRAGLEILIRRYGINFEEVETVYLAGGFGYKLNLEKAVHIGLLPPELAGKTIAIGNSSLKGAIRYLCDQTSAKRMEDIIYVSNEIALSNDEDFNKLYLEYMGF